LNGGSAIYVDAPGHRNDLLIDCGNDNAVEFVLKPFLRAQGVNRLPAVVLTHGDLRQIGGAESLISQVPTGCVVTSPARFRSKVYRQILSRLEKEPGLHRTVTRLNRIGDWTVLHPEASDDSAQGDDSALVLFGWIQGTRVLLLSDLGVLGQGVLLQREGKLQADIVVAGLSQGATSVSEALLEIVRPGLLVITDAKFPATRRAGAALRERLEKRGIPVLYTGSGGAICITVRSHEWEARMMDGTTVRGRAGR
jgi:competence protein ComEC